MQADHARAVRKVAQCWASQTNGTEPSPLTASSNGARTSTYDVVSLGNLCVDVVLHLDEVNTSSASLCSGDTVLLCTT